MRCLKETNRLVRELMAGNLSNKAIGRVQTVAAAENRGFRGLNIGGKTYKPKRMLRDLGTMNAGVERGNAALMQKHDVHYINADKETPAKELFQGGTQTTGGALAAQGKPLRAMFRKVRRTAVDESPEVAAGIGDALKELPQNKRHYIIHSPATTQKWAGKNSDPLIKRHEVNEIEAIDRNPAQAKVEEWKTGTRPVAGGHQHPVVLAKEMNLARRLNVHGLDIGGMKRMRRWSGEATALKSITGKTYGKQVLSNRELRNVAKLKPSKVVGGERWDLTGRKDRINRAVDEVAKAQPEFKRGEAKLVDWTKKLQNSNSSIGDYAKLTPPIGSKLSNTVRRPLTAKRLQDKARKEFHEALVGRSNLKEGNMKLHEMRRFMSRVGLCELREGPTADAVMAAARAREAPKVAKQASSIELANGLLASMKRNALNNVAKAEKLKDTALPAFKAKQYTTKELADADKQRKALKLKYKDDVHSSGARGQVSATRRQTALDRWKGHAKTAGYAAVGVPTAALMYGGSEQESAVMRAGNLQEGLVSRIKDAGTKLWGTGKELASDIGKAAGDTVAVGKSALENLSTAHHDLGAGSFKAKASKYLRRQKRNVLDTADNVGKLATLHTPLINKAGGSLINMFDSATIRAGNLQEGRRKPEKEDEVEMPKKVYKKEHKHLLKVLSKCKTAAAKQEARKQAKEMKDELGKVKESALREVRVTSQMTKLIGRKRIVGRRSPTDPKFGEMDAAVKAKTPLEKKRFKAERSSMADNIIGARRSADWEANQLRAPRERNIA